MRAIFIASLGVAAMPVFPPPAYAAEWAMTPSLRLGYEINDNYRMTLEPHNTVRGTTVIPRLDLGVQSEIWGITGSAAIIRKRFSGEEGLDRDDEAFSLSPQYRTERSSSALNISRVDDAVISGEQGDPDLGLVTIQKSRRTENIRPTWNWFMTERAKIQLDFQLSEVSYTDGFSVGLYDYQNRSATANWSYLLSPLSQIFFTGEYSRYHAPNTNIQSLELIPVGPFLVPAEVTISDVESKTSSASAGASHTFSETMQGTLSLGWRKTTTERGGEICSVLTGCSPASRPIETTGIIYSGDLNKKFEKINVRATASRSTDATGVGTEVERDSYAIVIDYPFTERITGTLATNYSTSRDVLKGIAIIDVGADVEHYSIQPALHWRWSREADLRLIYRYSHLKREQEEQAAESHAAYLTLDYTWPKISVSR